MATFILTPSSKWKAVIRLKNHPLTTKTFKSRDAAERWAEKTELCLELHTETGCKYPSFDKLFKLYITDAKKRMKRPDNELIHYKRVKALFRNRELHTLTTSDIDNKTKKRIEKKESKSTIRKDVMFLNRFLKFSIKYTGAPIDNPVKNAEKPKEPPPRERTYTDEELSLIYNNVTPTMQKVFELAAETSMRMSEILETEWRDVHVEERFIFLDGSRTKNSRSRKVPLSRNAAKLINSMEGERKGRLFNYTRSAVNSAISRARKRCNIENARFHDLRHTAITRRAKQGWSTPQLQVLSGHLTLSELNRYINLTVDDVVGLMD